MIKIDELDIFIIKEIYFNHLGTWDITKKYCTDKPMGFINAKHVTVKLRLKKLENSGLIVITKEFDEEQNIVKNVYNLIKENVKIGKMHFPCGYRDTLTLKTNQGWCSFEITK